MSDVNWSRVVGNRRGRSALAEFVAGRSIRSIISNLPEDLKTDFYNMERRGVKSSRTSARRVLSRA